MRQMVLIAAGLILGIGLTLATDPRMADMRRDLVGVLPGWIDGSGSATSP